MHKHKVDANAPEANLPEIIGHQGVRNDNIPGNSLAAFRAAKDAGCTWVELDVMLTRDGKPVVIHDKQVDKTTNGTGSVEKMDYAELKKLKLPNGEKIPTLSEALDALDKLGLGVNVEIKPSSPVKSVATAKKAAEVMKEKGFNTADKAFVSSFIPSALAAFKNLAPQIPRGLLQRVRGRSTFKHAQQTGCTAITFNSLFLTPRTIKKAQERGFAVGSYTVNKPARAARLWSLGVKSIFTDKPDVMFKELGKHRAKMQQLTGMAKSR